MADDTQRQRAGEGKFMPLEYEARAFGAVNGLCALRTLFQQTDSELILDAGTVYGVEWILTQAINELMATALNCENGRKA